MRRATALIALALALTSAGAAAAQAPPLMGALFVDHGVLQRDRPIAVWGHALPGEAVSVSIAGRKAQGAADDVGRWRLSLPALPAGGPYVLTAQAGARTQTASDVLIGDVWLCSGQSNMVVPVNRALNAPSEIAGSADDRIRMLTVPIDSRPTIQGEFVRPLTWKAAAPASVADFSAACFFFAQDLRRDHDVPMGLINSAWGGSMLQAWLSEPAVRQLGGYDEKLSILSEYPVQPQAAQARWGAHWEGWWRARAADTPWSEQATGDWRAVPSLTPWERWGEPALAAYNGMVWYRTEAVLTAAQAQQSATLTLGNVDEVDETWVNGKPVGASGGGDRVYPLPAGLLKAGRNSVVLNVLDTYAVGGLYGPPEKRTLRFADGSSVALDAGGWRYRVAGGFEPPPRAPWESLAGLTTIANAMIAPMAGYGLRGVLWYQGESNTEREPETYDRLMSGLMSDWRRSFDNPTLPFMVVSLANYGQPPTAPVTSGWAELRDRQRLAVRADPHAGLVVAVDIGDRWDIHPAQKRELGLRLARAARRVAYGEAIPPSGPEVVRARQEGETVVVEFENVTGGLATYSSDHAIGFELCDANGGGCRYVDAKATGTVVRLTAGSGPAGQVRFCWADSPVCNLFDAAGLPAGPFRIGVVS